MVCISLGTGNVGDGYHLGGGSGTASPSWVLHPLTACFLMGGAHIAPQPLTLGVTATLGSPAVRPPPPQHPYPGTRRRSVVLPGPQGWRGDTHGAGGSRGVQPGFRRLFCSQGLSAGAYPNPTACPEAERFLGGWGAPRHPPHLIFPSLPPTPNLPKGLADPPPAAGGTHGGGLCPPPHAGGGSRRVL